MRTTSSLLFVLLLGCTVQCCTASHTALEPGATAELTDMVEQTTRECEAFSDQTTSFRAFVSGLDEFLDGSGPDVTVKEALDMLLAFNESAFVDGQVKVLYPLIEFLLELEQHDRNSLLSAETVQVLDRTLGVILSQCFREVPNA